MSRYIQFFMIFFLKCKNLSFQHVCISLYLSVYLSIYLSTLFSYLSTYLPMCLFNFPTKSGLYMYICKYIHPVIQRIPLRQYDASFYCPPPTWSPPSWSPSPRSPRHWSECGPAKWKNRLVGEEKGGDTRRQASTMIGKGVDRVGGGK